jgi:hypothetical protein
VIVTANIQNDPGNGGVRWKLTQNGYACTPACGTINPALHPSVTALYTPPVDSLLSSGSRPTLTAIAVDDPSRRASLHFEITPPVKVVILNKFNAKYAGSSSTPLNAQISYGDSLAGVHWTITAGGTDCSPVCGSLQAVGNADGVSTAAYVPPSVVPTGVNASPTIAVSSALNPTREDRFTFDIDSPLALLKGHYAFLLRGYDLLGSPMAMVGSFLADGDGNIQSAELDFNNGGGLNHISAGIAGIYKINQSFEDATRGRITFTGYTFPESSIEISLAFVLSKDQKSGKAIEIDGAYINAGSLTRQDADGGVIPNPFGTYVFSLDSDAPVAARTVAVGRLILDSNGILSGLIDESRAYDSVPRYFKTPITGGDFSVPDAAGRGTLTITANGTSTKFAYYVINSSKFNLIQIDRGLKLGTVQAGIAVKQKALSMRSLDTSSVLQMTGMDSPHGGFSVAPAAIIGLMKISEAGAFQLTFDSNDEGIILTNHPAAGSIVSFDPVTGRGELGSQGGYNSGFLESAVFYLSDAGTGFIIDTDPTTPEGTPLSLAVTNKAYSGTLTPQVKGIFQGSSLDGPVMMLLGGSAAPATPSLESVMNFETRKGTYSAVGDLASLPSQGAALPNIKFYGNYALIDPVLGRGELWLPAPVLGDFSTNQLRHTSFYLIDQNHAVFLGIESGSYSGVGIISPF